MKRKLISMTLVMVVLLNLCSCVAQKTRVNQYQYMYDGMVELWNFHSDPDREDLFGYGEYLYQSYFLLFPRETPSTLTEYYFYWAGGIDYDDYAVYFTCRLTKERYDGFVTGLKHFKITYPDRTVAPVYDEEHFSYPTYILQWANVGKKQEVLEYVMLDDARCTAVFVYTMRALADIERHSYYKVTPSTSRVLQENFSIYGTYKQDYTNDDVMSDYIYDRFSESTYDISFLQYLH